MTTFLESELARHMADPKQYASMLCEHTRSIRIQLQLLDKRKRCWR